MTGRSMASRSGNPRPAARVGDLEIQLIADYRGASLAGKVIRIHNRGSKPLTLAERDLASPRHARNLDRRTQARTREPARSAFVVGASGETGHD
jgi:conjugal transfer pilus assembly protein TraK